MGVEAGETVRMAAFVKCAGDCDKTTKIYEYTGVEDCGMVRYVPDGGAKSCNYGCLGYGNCVKACPFDAIHIVNGIARVDKEKCKACGKCVAACPKQLIELIPYDSKVTVACSSRDKGPVTMKACQTGCIGCSLCVKVCPSGAVTVTDFHAHIDQGKCTGCGACKEKCPKKAIV
jgi:ferredoxin